MALVALLLSSVFTIPVFPVFSQSDPDDGGGPEGSPDDGDSSEAGSGSEEQSENPETAEQPSGEESPDDGSGETDTGEPTEEESSDDVSDQEPEEPDNGSETSEEPSGSDGSGNQTDTEPAGNQTGGEPVTEETSSNQTASGQGGDEGSDSESEESQPGESDNPSNQTSDEPAGDPSTSNQTSSEQESDDSESGGNVTGITAQAAGNQTGADPPTDSNGPGESNDPETQEVYVEIWNNGSGSVPIEEDVAEVEFAAGSIYFGDTIEQGGTLNMTVTEPEDFVDLLPEEELEEMAIQEEGDDYGIVADTGAGYKMEGSIVKIEFENATIAEERGVTLALEYDDAGLAEDEEQEVRILHFNHETLVWEVLQNDDESINGGEEVDAANNVVYGTTYSFSHFVPGSGPGGPNRPAIDDPDSPISDNTPTITGTKDADTSIELFDFATDTSLGFYPSDALITWSITTSTLADGSHTLFAVSEDSEGDNSTSTGAGIQIDTASPATPVISSPANDTTLSSSPDISGMQALIPFLDKWGSIGSGDGQFNGPQGIAHDLEGNYYTIESHRVQKFSSTGDFLDKWGSSAGSSDGQFNSPLGIEVDSSGNVYVADSFNNRIQKFDSDGTFITKWGAAGSGNGSFNSPRDIAIDSLGNVYVTDSQNYRIQKFDSDGNFLDKWGSNGAGNNQFNQASGIDIDSEDNVFVADTNNHRIQKFYTNGTFITKWGSFGSGNGNFQYPEDIAVDSESNVVVTDTYNHRIQKFDSAGVFIEKWGRNGGDGSMGSGDGQFAYPAGIDVDAADNILVADTSNHLIQKFGQELGVLTVEVFGDDVSIGATTVQSDGAWTFTPSPALGSGTHSVVARAVDEAGNAGSNSSMITFTITPPVPVIDAPTDGSITNDNLVGTISGTAQAGTTVTVYRSDDGNQLLGTALADESGNWFLPRHALLTSTSYESGTGFGLSISGGDFNGDGFDDVIVGAPFADNSTEDTGEVRIFLGGASGIDSVADAILIGPLDDDFPDFGISVAAGDVNGDGYDDAIVGADSVDGSATGAGEVWIFHGCSCGVDSTVDTILSGTGEAGAQFGHAVYSKDVNNDGFDDVIVGAPFADSGSFVDAGEVRIYHGSASGADTTADQVLAGPPQNSAAFGTVLSAGDVNGDGYDDVVVGIPAMDADAGMVQVFRGSDSGIIRPENVTLSGPEAQALFGSSLATGDINNDGYADVLVGANLVGASDNGEVQLFVGTAAGLGGEASATLTGVEGSSNFGVGVAAADIDSDGFGDVIVGAPFAGTFGQVSIYMSDSGVVSNAADEVLERSFPDPEFSGNIGSPLAAGDFNNDGYGDIITAGLEASTLSLFSGEVHAFFGPNFQTLQEGDNDLFARATDEEDNESPNSDVALVTLDTMPPSAPNPISPDFESLNNATIGFDWDDSTDDTFLPLTYELLITDDGDNFVLEAEVGIPDSDIILSTSLEDGSYEWRVRAVDAAGNPSQYGDISGFDLDTTPPETEAFPAGGTYPGSQSVELLFEEDDSGSIYYTTDGTTPDISSAVYAGEISVTEDTTLRFFGIDDNGNEEPFNTGIYIIDPIAPGAPAIADPATDIATNDDTLSLSGTAEPGSSIEIFDGETFVGATRADGSGDWSISNFMTRSVLFDPQETDSEFGYTLGHGDLNNDGYDDLIVGIPFADVNATSDSGEVHIFYGGAAGTNTTADAVLTRPAPADADFFGWAMAAGDINNDGFDDIIASTQPGFDTGEVLIYLGSSGLIDTAIDATITPLPDSGYGQSLAAGDFNNDGFDDVIVGAPFADNGDGGYGLVQLFLGGSSFDTTADADFTKPSDASDGFGWFVAAGDFNNDGFDDVATTEINAIVEDVESGEVQVFLGGSTLDNVADAVLDKTPPEQEAFFGEGLAVGDVNGDGFDDLLAGANGATNGASENGEIHIFLGTSTGVNNTADTVLTKEPPQGGAFSGFRVAAGDINNDGFDDVIMGIDGSDTGFVDSGEARIFFGSAGSFDTEADMVLTRLEESALFGFPVDSADVNNDGYDDIVVGSTGVEGDPAGQVHVFMPFGTFDEGAHAITASAMDAAGNVSPASGILTITVDVTPPTTPAALQPLDGSVTASGTPTLNWTIPEDAGAIVYDLLVDNNSDFSSPEESLDDADVGVPYAVTVTLADGTYFWKVRATDEAGNAGAFSSIYNFTIDATGPLSVTPATDAGPVDFLLAEGDLESIAAIDESALPDVESKPENMDFPFGFFSWTVTGLTPGESANMTLSYPSAVPAGSSYWKVMDGEWVNASSLLGSNDGDEIITLTITDGSSFDDDGQVNGQVSDPGGVGEGSGEITIRKTELGTGNLLNGSAFTITPDPFTLSGNLTVADNDASDSNSTDGIIELEGVAFATYTIEETTTPVGYERIVTSLTVSVHGGNLAPVVTVENRAEGEEIEETTEVPPPQLDEDEIEEFEDHGATVDGDPIEDADDLPPALIAPPDEAGDLDPDDVIFTEQADSDTAGSDLFEDFGIPTYPAPDESIASEVVYAPPAFVVPADDGSNFVLTPIIEEIFDQMTLLFVPPNSTAAESASIQSVEIEFGQGGDDVGFSFELSSDVPGDLPELDDVEASALFLDVDFVGSVNFSNPDVFASPPEFTILVDRSLEGEKLADGCPDIQLYLLNENTGEWEAVETPARDPDGDTADECSYTVHTEHFSKFAIGSVKGSITNVSTRGAGAGDGTRTVSVDGTFGDEYFDVNPLARVSIDQPAFLAVSGRQDGEIAEGETVEISTSIRNHQRDPQPYVFIVQVLDEEGIAESVSWSTGLLERAQSQSLGLSWLPEESGNYQVRIYVWSGLDSPEPLSGVTARMLQVSGAGQGESA